MQKTKDATFEESFEKLYQERKAKELNEEALKRADKLVSDIYAGKFNKYRDLVDYLEKNNHEDTE